MRLKRLTEQDNNILIGLRYVDLGVQPGAQEQLTVSAIAPGPGFVAGESA
jgi:hypothetical protein